MRKRTSNEVFNEVKRNGNKTIVSFLPNDPHDCDCFGLVREWGEKLHRMSPDLASKVKEKPIQCPRAKGLNKYAIYCRECGDLIAYVHASDSELTDWCNLHYISEARIGFEYQNFNIDGKLKKKKVEICEWHGCMGLQISSIDDKLGFECSCGNDTRDFRVKNNLTGYQLKDKLNNNMIDRDFNTNSKFIVKEAQ